ncbi:hypothetical protein METBIDRAFT_34513 [Metschnikowia bicuspidata var. bicuspidata NRRL YB-4993]|uniref:Plasma membrane fusion protein PRM1 n=1 Tax=Metschnikowia bicuspidata var. bicuspidata NRRL YB-4993 TaxID=869754 RepID=A0A1A0HG34_9ASCO|nr:hypothetical protein METBIDRAFT_34513 [Metschnikowia bicuspidata var. bicuspidata NRRL YB-4993]OBA22961.1 hypothetical protein METBIDRAFT_34513 [Metschnikowia bicuspidata var. bicuspidata NRRL YB-4993]
MRHYLNLAETLLQAWLDQTLIFLVLATLKVYFFSSALISMISAVSESSMPLCRQLELLASDLEQAPAQMSRITSLVLATLAANTHNLVEKLVYLLAAIAKSIISLLLELYLGTLTCLITALVQGTLDLVSDILEDITLFVQNAINTVLDEFNSALSGLSSVINTVTTAVSAVESLFSSSDESSLTSDIDTVNLTVSSLSNITIPTSWIGDIDDLANDIPDFEDVLSNVLSLLTSPITELTQSFANASFNFTLNDTLLSQSANATQSMCDEYESVLDSAISATRSMADYIVLGLCIGIVLYTVVAWVFSYFRMRKQSLLFEALSKIDTPEEVGNSIGHFEHGFMGIFTSRWKPEFQWLYSYLTTSNLRMCLLVGLLGWLVVLLQFVTLQQTTKILGQLLTGGTLSSQTKGQLIDEFSQYLDDAQISLDDAVDEVNEALFSSIHNTSSVILDKLDFFQTSVNDTINVVFGSSFLASPLRTIIYCTIGRKVDTIEKGLQWIESNTIFEAPSLESSYMEEVFESSTPDVSNVLLSVADNVISAVQKVIQGQKKALWKEFFISTAFVGVWFLYLLLGLALLANRKFVASDPDPRLDSQAISWPTQLCEEAQREYSYPFNNPYVVSNNGKHIDGRSIVSDLPSLTAEIRNPEPHRHEMM